MSRKYYQLFGDNTCFCSIFLILDCIFGTKNGLKYDDHTCFALCEPVCITMEKENVCLV